MQFMGFGVGLLAATALIPFTGPIGGWLVASAFNFGGLYEGTHLETLGCETKDAGNEVPES
jgi:hypothetical protein